MHSSIKADFNYELSEEDLANGVIKLKKVGFISAYRINLFESELCSERVVY